VDVDARWMRTYPGSSRGRSRLVIASSERASQPGAVASPRPVDGRCKTREWMVC
jgi:hypothetical protein